MNIINMLKKDDAVKKPGFYKMIAVAVIFFGIIILLNSKLSKVEEVPENKKPENDISEEWALFFDTEKNLEQILSKIKGAGNVEVMIYYSNYGEKIIASNSKTRNEKEKRGEGVESFSEDREKNTVLYGSSGNEVPFITEERLPEASGILVIAEGANNEKVKYEIQEAVRALLGISPNRIRVAEKNKVSR